MQNFFRVFIFLLTYFILIFSVAEAQRGGGSGITSSEYLDITRIDEVSVASRLNGFEVLDSNSPLGDNVNMDTGSLSFTHTDVSIPGNSDLPVTFGRSYTVDGADIADNIYGGWNPEVPYITAKITLTDHFGPGMDWQGHNCMRPPIGRIVQVEAGSEDALRSTNSFWEGVSMHLPGEGNKLLLLGSYQPPSNVEGISLNQGTSQDTRPIFAGGPSGQFALVRTQDNWVFTCPNGGNIGAVAHAPNGWKYYFDHVTITRAGDRNLLRLITAVDQRGVSYQCSHNGPRSNCLSFAAQNIGNLNVMATRIEDQHGNWVEYDYDGMSIKSIISNDGRRIDFTYEDVSYNASQRRDESGTRLKTIHANGRSWKFNYSIKGVYSHLKKITLPDSRTWEFDLPPMRVKSKNYACYHINRSGVVPETYTVKAPSGLLATYNLELRRYGKSGVPKRDLNPPPQGLPSVLEDCDDNKIPKFSVLRALISKTYDVANGDKNTWQYKYQNDEGHFASAGSSGLTLDLRRNEMIDPEGNRTVVYYNRRFQSDDEGLISRREYYDGETGARIETVHMEYEKGLAMGNSGILFSFSPPLTHSRPIKKIISQRDGDTFTTEMSYNFNTSSPDYSYNRPTQTKTYSNVSTTPRITTTDYEHNKVKWILGLPKKVTQNGRELRSYVYNNSGQKVEQRRNGHLDMKFGYYPNLPSSVPPPIPPISRPPVTTSPTIRPPAPRPPVSRPPVSRPPSSIGRPAFGGRRPFSTFGPSARSVSSSSAQAGALHWVEDALGRRTYLSDWKAGVPQKITRADGISEYQTVDNNGWTTSRKDALGRTERYKHDIMGRLTQIDPHGSWANTDIAYSFPSSGGAVQTITRGQSRTTVTYDSMFRAILERSQALDTGWSSYVNTKYDGLGRAIFTSQPSSRANETKGVESRYDGLGRMTQRRENVAPYATTKYQYLNSHRRRVTDPSGKWTDYYSYGYDGPSNDDYRAIYEYADGAYQRRTYLYKNVHGQLTRLRQWGNQGGVNIDKSQYFYYDNRLRLCRHYVPEHGATLYQYDNAHQMIAYAKGQRNAGCGTVPNSAAKVALSYDDLGRLIKTNYIDAGTPDITRSYDSNSNLTSLNRGSGTKAVNWRYSYNDGDLLTSEQLTLDGRIYNLGYSYNNNGHMTVQSSPSGRRLTYKLDGLGRPLGVGDAAQRYAWAMRYHVTGQLEHARFENTANGQPRGFGYSFNDRQLISRYSFFWGYTADYNYDANGRITKIDHRYAQQRDRSFTYDGLGQLTSATSPMWGGTANYRYDSLGNLRQKTLGTRTVNLTYDSRNRLTRSADTGAPAGQGTGTRTLAYDARGNVTTLGSMGFIYDYSDQPVSVSGTVNGNYTYDGNLKRVKAKVNGKTIYNVYNAAGRLVYIDDIGRRERTDFVHAGGQMIARVKNNVPEWVYPDHLGSTVMTINKAGAISGANFYTPFGELAETQRTPNDDNTGFTGHIKDSATGLNYMQARYYDPVIGRFLSVDPVMFMDTGNPSYFNRYAYAWNDPINVTDPDGRCNVTANLGCESGRDMETVLNENTMTGTQALIAVETILIIGDLIAGGPTGEGIGPAMAIKAAREGGETAMQRGVRKEADTLADMGLKKNAQKVSSPEGNSVPDALTDTRSVEVKDTKSVCCSKQVRIQTDAAKASGRESVLVTGANTKVNDNAKAAFDRVIRRDDLGPQQ